MISGHRACIQNSHLSENHPWLCWSTATEFQLRTNVKQEKCNINLSSSLKSATTWSKNFVVSWNKNNIFQINVLFVLIMASHFPCGQNICIIINNHPIILQAHLKFPPDYPYNPPSIRFLSKVWHPNVYEVIIQFLSHPSQTLNSLERGSVCVHPSPPGGRPPVWRAAL